MFTTIEGGRMPDPVGTNAGLSWTEFRMQQPDLAAAGRDLLYQFSVGLAFLSTVRRDGGPRLHPICPILTDLGMFALIIPSPKLDDLLRDGRYALHSYPTEDNEDAFYVTGRATRVEDPEIRGSLQRQFIEERPTIDLPASEINRQTLVEFFVERCLLTRTTGHGDPNPRHEIWHLNQPI
jgi:hypothetical protein